jgi:hypothetical protein
MEKQMDSKIYIAEEAYSIIQKKSEDNTIVQSLSGIFGWPITIGTDIAVIPMIYVPLWDRIRELYSLSNIAADAMSNIIKGILSEIFVDIALDKVMGNVPLIGIYFNAICAKTMTWRLGTLFTMLSAQGPDVEHIEVRDSMALIRKVFPQSDMFKFTTPEKEAFLKLVDGISNVTPEEYNRKVHKMLDMMDQM